MIQIKNIEVLRSLLGVNYHSILIDLVSWCSENIQDIVITDGYRRGSKGVHGTVPCRGKDLRSSIYEDPQAITVLINNDWEYDNKRPRKQCALYHARCPKCKKDYKHIFRKYCECGVDITNHWHIHLQVHPNTRRRGNKK